MGIFGELAYSQGLPERVGQPLEELEKANTTLNESHRLNKERSDALEIMAKNLDIEDIDYEHKKAAIDKLRETMADTARRGDYMFASDIVQGAAKDFTTNEPIRKAVEAKGKLDARANALRAMPGMTTAELSEALALDRKSYSGVKPIDANDLSKGYNYDYKGFNVLEDVDLSDWATKITSNYKADGKEGLTQSGTNSEWLKSVGFKESYADRDALKADIIKSYQASQLTDRVGNRAYINSGITKVSDEELIAGAELLYNATKDEEDKKGFRQVDIEKVTGEKAFLAIRDEVLSKNPELANDPEELKRLIHAKVIENKRVNEAADAASGIHGFKQKGTSVEYDANPVYAAEKAKLVAAAVTYTNNNQLSPEDPTVFANIATKTVDIKSQITELDRKIAASKDPTAINTYRFQKQALEADLHNTTAVMGKVAEKVLGVGQLEAYSKYYIGDVYNNASPTEKKNMESELFTAALNYYETNKSTGSNITSQMTQFYDFVSGGLLRYIPKLNSNIRASDLYLMGKKISSQIAQNADALTLEKQNNIIYFPDDKSTPDEVLSERNAILETPSSYVVTNYQRALTDIITDEDLLDLSAKGGKKLKVDLSKSSVNITRDAELGRMVSVLQLRDDEGNPIIYRDSKQPVILNVSPQDNQRARQQRYATSRKMVNSDGTTTEDGKQLAANARFSDISTITQSALSAANSKEGLIVQGMDIASGQYYKFHIYPVEKLSNTQTSFRVERYTSLDGNTKSPLQPLKTSSGEMKTTFSSPQEFMFLLHTNTSN